MSAALRMRHHAVYDYPGSFFPESTSRSLDEPTLTAAIAAGPDEDDYFTKDGWYAVTISTVTEKLFTADGEEAWVKQGDTVTVGKWVVGERIHYSDIEDTRDNAILISNIRGNSKDGFGVKTRRGNWQIASDFTHVVSPEEVAA